MHSAISSPTSWKPLPRILAQRSSRIMATHCSSQWCPRTRTAVKNGNSTGSRPIRGRSCTLCGAFTQTARSPQASSYKNRSWRQTKKNSASNNSTAPISKNQACSPWIPCPFSWAFYPNPTPSKKTITLAPDSILTVYPDGTRGLYFTGSIIVLFGVSARTAEDYKTSGLMLLKPQIITLQENGRYSSPQDLLAQGAWALFEKICNLLPLDYEP